MKSKTTKRKMYLEEINLELFTNDNLLIKDTNDDYHHNLINYTIITCKPLKQYEYLLNELDFNNKEFIYSYEAIKCYQLPTITNNLLDKFIHTFKFLNKNAKESDLRQFLKQYDILLVNKAVDLFNQVKSIEFKKLFIKDRHLIYNNKNIISNNKFNYKQFDEFIKYKQAIKVESISNKRLFLFKNIYSYSDKSINSIKSLYKARNLNIKTSTIISYARQLNLIISNNKVDYNSVINDVLKSVKKINYNSLLDYINNNNSSKICLKTLKNNLTIEHKELIKQHNKDISMKKNEVKTVNSIINEYYNNSLLVDLVVRFNDITNLIELIKDEADIIVNYTTVKNKLKAIDKSLKFERKPKQKQCIYQDNKFDFFETF